MELAQLPHYVIHIAVSSHSLSASYHAGCVCVCKCTYSTVQYVCVNNCMSVLSDCKQFFKSNFGHMIIMFSTINFNEKLLYFS